LQGVILTMERGSMGNKSFTRSLGQCHKPIVFTLEDREVVAFPHEDALIISTVISNHRVHWVLVDDDGVVNILFTKVII